MAQVRHLERAPIAEAVIELQVRAADGFTADSLLPLSERLKEEYPVVEKIQTLAATFGMQEGRPTPTDTNYEQLGILLRTADRHDVVQLRTNGFAFSQLHPYTSWDSVMPRAMALWSSYCELAKPRSVTRLGVRYINRLRLPLPVDLSAHLIGAPVVPEMLPQLLRAYLTRLVLQDPENANSVVVTQASEPSTDQQHLVILLDLDAFREGELDPTDGRINSILESLRHLKNRAFFGSITERTAEMHL